MQTMKSSRVIHAPHDLIHAPRAINYQEVGLFHAFVVVIDAWEGLTHANHQL